MQVQSILEVSVKLLDITIKLSNFKGVIGKEINFCIFLFLSFRNFQFLRAFKDFENMLILDSAQELVNS